MYSILWTLIQHQWFTHPSCSWITTVLSLSWPCLYNQGRLYKHRVSILCVLQNSVFSFFLILCFLKAFMTGDYRKSFLLHLHQWIQQELAVGLTFVRSVNDNSKARWWSSPCFFLLLDNRRNWQYCCLLRDDEIYLRNYVEASQVILSENLEFSNKNLAEKYCW